MILENNTYLKITEKDMEKYNVIKKAINRKLTNREAGLILKLSDRQIRRLKNRVNQFGIKGIIHKSRGRPGNRKIKKEILDKTKHLLKIRYYDFGPTFASEKLEEEYGIKINKETIRLVMINLGLRTVRKRKNNKKYREWRERKFNFGEMIQFDGSYHDWFETGVKNCLLVSIDDATSKVYAKFEKNEGLNSVFRFWKEYCFKFGKPISIYLDKFSTYKVNNNKNEFNDIQFKTKFNKITDKLDIELITAHSPQAKGRVERQNGVLQDRLVKELRLNNIKTVKEANLFLENTFLPKYNKRFMVMPKRKNNLHRRLIKQEIENIDGIFSVEKTRVVNNDFTISYDNTWYQLEKYQPTLVLRKDRIIVQTRLDGSIHLFLRNKELNFRILPKRPKKINENKFKEITALTKEEVNSSKANKPSLNHPWRKTNSLLFKDKVNIKEKVFIK